MFITILAWLFGCGMILCASLYILENRECNALRKEVLGLRKERNDLRLKLAWMDEQRYKF